MFAHSAEIGKILREHLAYEQNRMNFWKLSNWVWGHFNSKSFHCRFFGKYALIFSERKSRKNGDWAKVPVQSKIFQCRFFPIEVSWIQYSSVAPTHPNNPHLFFSFPLILRSPEVRRGKETEHCADFCSFVACVAFLSLTDK